jgi:hypothetical protein
MYSKQVAKAFPKRRAGPQQLLGFAQSAPGRDQEYSDDPPTRRFEKDSQQISKAFPKFFSARHTRQRGMAQTQLAYGKSDDMQGEVCVCVCVCMCVHT